MTAMYPTNLERRHASQHARNMAWESAKMLKRDAQQAIDEIVRGLSKLRDCGSSKDYLTDTLKGLADEASNIEALVGSELLADPNWEGLDLVDLYALLEKVRA